MTCQNLLTAADRGAAGTHSKGQRRDTVRTNTTTQQGNDARTGSKGTISECSKACATVDAQEPHADAGGGGLEPPIDPPTAQPPADPEEPEQNDPSPKLSNGADADSELDWSRATINEQGVAAVERHLARFEEGSAETGMVERLRAILRGELEPTEYDLRFYTHELRESVLYRQAGYATGQPADPDIAYDLWDRLHSRALNDYGLTRRGAPNDLFHPHVRP